MGIAQECEDIEAWGGGCYSWDGGKISDAVCMGASSCSSGVQMKVVADVSGKVTAHLLCHSGIMLFLLQTFSAVTLWGSGHMGVCAVIAWCDMG